jgi:hypothetical protein
MGLGAHPPRIALAAHAMPDPVEGRTCHTQPPGFTS